MTAQRGAVLPLLMSALVAVSAMLFMVGQSIFVHRHSQRRTETTERAYYAAEAGLEAALADLHAGRTPAPWSASPVRASISVTRTGGAIEIASTGTFQERSVTLSASIVRQNGQYRVMSRNRGLLATQDP